MDGFQYDWTSVCSLPLKVRDPCWTVFSRRLKQTNNKKNKKKTIEPGLIQSRSYHWAQSLNKRRRLRGRSQRLAGGSGPKRERGVSKAPCDIRKRVFFMRFSGNDGRMMDLH